MPEEHAALEIARLEGLVGDDPGAPAFPALAEAHRRAGNAAEAARVAREGLRRRAGDAAGRVALGLALLDLGRDAEARRELERVLAAVPDHPLAAGVLAGAEPARPLDTQVDFDSIEEPEIEAAFEQAEPEEEHMVSADSVAQQALRAVENGGFGQGPESGETELPFATRTVADLLERQGHPARARAMREVLASGARPPARAPDGRGRKGDAGRVVAALERWLANLRRKER